MHEGARTGDSGRSDRRLRTGRVARSGLSIWRLAPGGPWPAQTPPIVGSPACGAARVRPVGRVLPTRVDTVPTRGSSRHPSRLRTVVAVNGPRLMVSAARDSAVGSGRSQRPPERGTSASRLPRSPGVPTMTPPRRDARWSGSTAYSSNTAASRSTRLRRRGSRWNGGICTACISQQR